MPLFNEAFWQERIGTSGATWSGDRWLDWEHGIVCRTTFRKIWWMVRALPRGRAMPIDQPMSLRDLHVRVLDIGGGDGRFGAWLEDELDAAVFVTDGIDWPEGHERFKYGEITGYAAPIDAEHLAEYPVITKFRPEVALFMNSLTCMADWRAATAHARYVSDVVVCFDNFQDPTPAYWVNLPHRVPIPNGELVADFKAAGWTVAMSQTADVIHRRWLRVTPRWSHRFVAAASAVVDYLAQSLVKPEKARHSAWVFVKSGER